MSGDNVKSVVWEEEDEAAISQWFVDDAAQVSEGDLIAEMMVEKVQYEIEAPATGKLRILKQQEEVVASGDVIATIE